MVLRAKPGLHFAAAGVLALAVAAAPVMARAVTPACAPAPPPAPIKSGWLTLERQYKVPEGRYFGNRFVDPPVSCVCSERLGAAKTTWLRQRPRLCALPSEKTDDQDRYWTVCEMRPVGACDEPGVFTQDSVACETSVQVFLPENGKPAR